MLGKRISGGPEIKIFPRSERAFGALVSPPPPINFFLAETLASPGGLPAGEATPSRQSYADCGRGTPGGRLPRRPGSIYTVHPTAAQTGILFSWSPRSLLQRFPLCTVVYLRLKVSFTGFSLGKLREKRLTV